MFKLLIADDERNTREGLIECIEWQKLGIEKIEQASDGVIALEKAQIFRPDIILCDIRMPRMNGLEFAGKVREILSGCKIIFLSGYSDKEYLKTAIQLQAVDYVEKPVNLDEIRNAVSKAISLLEADAGKNEKSANAGKETPEAGISKKVAGIIRFINTNLSDINLSLRSISDFSSLVPTYICAIFKAETGKTIRQYITGARMEKAKELLIGNKLKIHRVAALIGYADPKYFAKLFRKNVGITPSQYRERTSR